MVNEGIEKREQSKEVFKTILDMENEYEAITPVLHDDKERFMSIVLERKGMYSIGSSVSLGHYMQTKEGNDMSPIVWKVIGYRDNKALLLAEQCLDTLPFSTNKVVDSWRESEIREWLNGKFFYRAFSEKEKNFICETFTENRTGMSLTKNASECYDKVFLLNEEEVNKYLEVSSKRSELKYHNEKACAYPTEYAIKKGAQFIWHNMVRSENGQLSVSWWLRTLGEKSYEFDTWGINKTKPELVRMVHGVTNDGFSGEYEANRQGVCVRPAIWVNLEYDACN